MGTLGVIQDVADDHYRDDGEPIDVKTLSRRGSKESVASDGLGLSRLDVVDVQAEPTAFAKTITGETLVGNGKRKWGSLEQHDGGDGDNDGNDNEAKRQHGCSSSFMPFFPSLANIELSTFFPGTCLFEMFNFAEPSPDDIVMRAQRGAKGMRPIQ